MDSERAWLEFQLMLLDAGAEIVDAIPDSVDTDSIMLEEMEREFNE